MKLKEVIKLAAAGYAVSEIREIGELSARSPEVISLADGRKLDDIKELLSLADSEEDQEDEKKDQEGAGESDRKADPEIEKIKIENEKLREDLKKAQKVNASRPADLKEDKTPEDVLVDMMLNL